MNNTTQQVINNPEINISKPKSNTMSCISNASPMMTESLAKAVNQLVKQQLTKLRKAGALTVTVAQAWAHLESGIEIERPVSKPKAKKAKKPKMTDEERAAKKEKAESIKEEKRLIKEEQKKAKAAEKDAKKIAKAKVAEEKKALKAKEAEEKKALKAKAVAEKKAFKAAEKEAKKAAKDALKNEERLTKSRAMVKDFKEKFPENALAIALDTEAFIEQHNTLKTLKSAISACRKDAISLQKMEKKKAPKKAKVKSIATPFREVQPTKCYGIKKNSGLYTQCNKSAEEYCNTCSNAIDKAASESTKPPHGDARDRTIEGWTEGNK